MNLHAYKSAAHLCRGRCSPGNRLEMAQCHADANISRHPPEMMELRQMRVPFCVEALTQI